MDISVEFGRAVDALDNDSIGGVIGKLDQGTLAKALKTVGPETSERIFANIPGDESDRIRQLVKDLGPVRIEEVEAAQKEILDTIELFPKLG
ncbi:MAG: hypothetical protein LBO76_04855 [Treponema sp.]|jgi:flagellar motor switch protein FliG|nr:hypothetical protein [Treponema sp.]